MSPAHRPRLRRPRPIVIAHRGASGYLPEHTLAAYAVAILQGADFIEPDLVVTRDGALIARHDNRLDLTTDVACRPEFADRQAAKKVDGVTQTGWFSEDFTLDEVRQLRAIERIPDIRPANARFDRQFTIPTLQEIVDLAQAMERMLGRRVGLYPETKHPTYFAQQGLPLEAPLVAALHTAGYASRPDAVFIQSFEISNLKTLRSLTPLPLVQLLDSAGSPYDAGDAGVSYDQMATAEGLKRIAEYADAVGPEKLHFLLRGEAAGSAGATEATGFVENAHAAGLRVHPYTFRAENRFLLPAFRVGPEPGARGQAEAELKAFLDLGIDGFFIDQPDIGAAVRDRAPS